MTKETESLVLEHLRQIRKVVEEVRDDVSDLKLRALATERHIGEVQVQMAGMNSRMDRFDERLARIERRLDLAEV